MLLFRIGRFAFRATFGTPFFAFLAALLATFGTFRTVLLHPFIPIISLLHNSLTELTFLQFLDKRKLTPAYLVLHKQVELELTVTEAVLQTCGLEARVCIGLQDMRHRLMQAER